MNAPRSAHCKLTLFAALALLAGALEASAIVPHGWPHCEIAHGEVAARTGSTATPFLFVGAAGVTSEGGTLYRMGARFYDAGLRRFLSPDPLGIDGGFNLYAYADADPVNRTDPLGLCAQSGGIRPFAGNDFGLNALQAKDRMRNNNPSRFYEVYGNDRDVQIEIALGLMLNIALMAVDVPAAAGSTRALGAFGTTTTLAKGVQVGLRSASRALTLNPIQWYRTQQIVSRARASGMAVSRPLFGARAGFAVGRPPQLQISPLAHPTAAIEEYLHGRFMQIVGSRRTADVLANPLLRTGHEIRLKSLMIQSGRGGTLGSGRMNLDLEFLVQTRQGYEAERSFWLGRRAL